MEQGQEDRENKREEKKNRVFTGYNYQPRQKARGQRGGQPRPGVCPGHPQSPPELDQQMLPVCDWSLGRGDRPTPYGEAKDRVAETGAF